MTDIALTVNRGEIEAHRVDCQVVHTHRILGQPVVTMLQCQNPLPPGIPRHSCLESARDDTH